MGKSTVESFQTRYVMDQVPNNRMQNTEINKSTELSNIYQQITVHQKCNMSWLMFYVFNYLSQNFSGQ